MNYIVPFDFSENSRTAAAYAAALSKVWNGNVHLVHIFVPMEEEPSYLSVKTMNVKRNTVFELFSYQESLRKTTEIRTSSEMLKGEFIPQIRKAAAREKSNIIVMGAQGSSGLRKHLYGSNTMNVLENISVPTLVVPDGATFTGYENILYATNYDPNELNNLGSLLRISKRFNGELSIVSFNSEVEDDIKKTFADRVKELLPEARVSFSDLIDDGDTAESLQRYISKRQFTLLAIPNVDEELTRKIAGRSVSTDFVFESSVPVLFLP